MEKVDATSDMKKSHSLDHDHGQKPRTLKL